MKYSTSFKNWVYTFITALFLLMMIAILGLILVVDHRIPYSHQTDISLPNIVLLLFGLVLCLLGVFVYCKFFKSFIQRLTSRQCNGLLFLVCALVLILQLVYAYNIYFITGWDAGTLWGAAQTIADHQLLDGTSSYSEYFARYPNNILLVFFFTLVCKLSRALKFVSYEYLLAVFSVLSVNISLWFVVKSARILTGSRHISLFTAVLFIVFIAFSPWIVIPYSDTYVICFTSGIIYFYLSKSHRNIYLSWLIIFTLSFLGYFIKPTCVIVLIAISLIEIWRFVFEGNKKKKLLIIPVMLVSILLSGMVSLYAQKYVGYEKDPDRAFPMTHYLMMGLNPETHGSYYTDDVLLTDSIIGKDQKRDVHMAVIKERLKEYGPVGYIKLLVRKSLTNYNDGSFAWGREGNFYLFLMEEKNGWLSPLLRSIAYDNGRFYPYLQLFQQCLWVLILALSSLSVVKIKDKTNKNAAVIMLTLIGITLFLLLFEGRARYLLLYAPYYILLAGVGLQVILRKTVLRRLNYDN